MGFSKPIHWKQNKSLSEAIDNKERVRLLSSWEEALSARKLQSGTS
jgi:hypothetical protein